MKNNSPLDAILEIAGCLAVGAGINLLLREKERRLFK